MHIFHMSKWTEKSIGSNINGTSKHGKDIIQGKKITLYEMYSRFNAAEQKFSGPDILIKTELSK